MLHFADDINVIPIENNLIVYHSGSRRCWVLNPLAARIFSGLRDGLSRKSIVDVVSRHHGVSPLQADELFDEALSSWMAAGLLVDENAITSSWPAYEQSAYAPPLVEVPPLKRYTICGLHFSLGFSDGELRNALGQLFASYMNECDEHVDVSLYIVRCGAGYVLYEDDSVVEVSDSASVISNRFFQRLVSAVAGGCDVRACLHSAVVLKGDAVYLVSGKSLSGKSTFATALSFSGFEMLNDEFAFVCGDDHTVKSMPLPAKLRRNSWGLLDQFSREISFKPVCMQRGEPVKFFPGADVSLARLRQGFGLGGMCFLHRSQAATPQCLRISATEAFVRLIEGESWVDPDFNKLNSLIKWLETVPSFVLCYADLRQAVDMMKRCVCCDRP